MSLNHALIVINPTHLEPTVLESSPDWTFSLSVFEYGSRRRCSDLGRAWGEREIAVADEKRNLGGVVVEIVAGSDSITSELLIGTTRLLSSYTIFSGELEQSSQLFQSYRWSIIF